MSISQSKDYTIIDAKDQTPIDYDVVPMFVQHTEAMMEEIDEMVLLSFYFGTCYQ